MDITLIPPSSVKYNNHTKLVSYGGKYSWNKEELKKIYKGLGLSELTNPTRKALVDLLLCKISDTIVDTVQQHDATLTSVRTTVQTALYNIDNTFNNLLDVKIVSLGGNTKNKEWFHFFKQNIIDGKSLNLWNTASLLGIVPFDKYDFDDHEDGEDGEDNEENTDNHWMGTTSWNMMIHISHEGQFITRDSQEIDSICPLDFIDENERANMFHAYRTYITGYMEKEMARKVTSRMNMLGFFAYTASLGMIPPIQRDVSIRPRPMGLRVYPEYLTSGYIEAVEYYYDELVIIDPVPYRTVSSEHGLFTALLETIRLINTGH
jgi:hypothetical protein